MSAGRTVFHHRVAKIHSLSTLVDRVRLFVTFRMHVCTTYALDYITPTTSFFDIDKFTYYKVNHARCTYILSNFYISVCVKKQIITPIIPTDWSVRVRVRVRVK